jgi:peptidyl-prolyl cis-trans isomerase SurA
MLKQSLFLLSAALFACSPALSFAENGLGVVNRTVAIVNDGVITQNDLDTAVNLQRMQASAAGIAIPNDLSIQQQSLQALISQTAALQLAKRNQITVSDQAVTDSIHQILERSHHTSEELHQNLEKFNLTEGDYREFIRHQLILRALAEKAIASNITVTPDEVSAYLSQQKNASDSQETYHVAHILIALPPNPSPEDIAKTKAKAEDVAKEIQGGLDFSTAAVKYSASGDASTGGDLGSQPLNMLPTLFVGPVKNLKPGEVSAPFSSPSGYHLIKLISVETAAPLAHVITQYQIKQILIRNSPVVSNDEAKTILEHLKIALQNGKSFETVARENSQDPISAGKGGLMDFASIDDLGPYYASILQALKPGQLSEPFQIQGGWALIQLVQTREHDDTADFAKREASNAIFQKKAMDAMDTWEAQVRGESYVNILDPALNPES